MCIDTVSLPNASRCDNILIYHCISRAAYRLSKHVNKFKGRYAYFYLCNSIVSMLCALDTEQECNTAARHQVWTEDSMRRSEEQFCLLGLRMFICIKLRQSVL